MFGNWSGNSAVNARLEFENAKQGLIKAGLDPQTIVDSALTPGYLRFEQLLPAGVNQILFPVLNLNAGSSTAVRPTESAFEFTGCFLLCRVKYFFKQARKRNRYRYAVIYLA